MHPHQVARVAMQKGRVGPQPLRRQNRADVGREDEAAFEAYARALEQTRPEAASGSAPLTQRPAEEAADMAVDASPAPRPATAHNAGASAASAEAGCTSAGCEEEAAAAEADEARSGETAMGYLGEYNAAGEFEGRGVMRYANGDVYEGEYKAGEKEGRGVYRLRAPTNGDT